jgi:hypothetical protein
VPACNTLGVARYGVGEGIVTVNIARGVAALLIFGSIASIGFASSACADDPPGMYAVIWKDGSAPDTWTTMSCGFQCRHIVDMENGSEKWSADAYGLNGHWTMFVDRPDMIICPDGTAIAGNGQYLISGDLSGAGVAYINNSGACGDAPGVITREFTLQPL